MPRLRRLLALVPVSSTPGTTGRLTPAALTLARLRPTLAALAAGLALAASTAGAQGTNPSDTPLHLAASRFEFVASGEADAPAKPLRVHNGGTTRFTDVRLVRVAYADSARGAGWLVATPRQSAVAPDELATIGTLCVNPAGLEPGTYRATAAVAAREVPEPVPFTITLVVKDAGARARPAAASCAPAAAK